MQQRDPVYLVKLIKRTIPTMTDAVNRFDWESFSGEIRISTQARTTMQIEAIGNQKSKLRIGVDGCSQNNANTLLIRITHLCRRTGAIQTMMAEITLITRMLSIFIPVG